MPPGHDPLSIVVPVRNESSRMECTIRRLVFELGLGAGDEVLVVDGGSTDGTADIVRQFVGCKGADIRLLELVPSRGKWQAVRAGLLQSRGELVLVTDADLSASLESYAGLLGAILDGADLAIGSRAVAGAVICVPQPMTRIVLGRLGNALLRLASPRLRPFRDTQCGFKLMRGDLARTLAPILAIDGFGGDFELIHAACAWGYQVVEVPVDWTHADGSKVRYSDYPRALADLALLMVEDRRGRYQPPPGPRATAKTRKRSPGVRPVSG